jgi:dTDP-4-amino-4,6-dideoxygalactose transaminase
LVACSSDGLTLPTEPEWARSNWQSFCVRLPAGVDQRQAMQSMLDAGVSTRRAVMCAHREPAFAQHEPWSCGSVLETGCNHTAGQCRRLTESERAQDDGIILPLFDQMTDADQDTVVAALRAAVSRGALVPA